MLESIQLLRTKKLPISKLASAIRGAVGDSMTNYRADSITWDHAFLEVFTVDELREWQTIIDKKERFVQYEINSLMEKAI